MICFVQISEEESEMASG